MTRVYIAGPMTGLPDYNFPAFNRAAIALQALGYDVCNPADIGVREGWGHTDYMRATITLMMGCNVVALLPGWEDSEGARIEASLADDLGIECATLHRIIGSVSPNIPLPAPFRSDPL